MSIKTQIVGLSPSQKYDYLVSTYAQRINDIASSYCQNIDDILKQRGFGEGGIGNLFLDVAAIPFSVVYSTVKGGFEGIVGAAQSINLLLTNFVNDVKHVFDESDGTNWTTDLNYAMTNLGVTVAEGLGVSGVSLAGNLWGMFGGNTDWAFGEDGLVDTIADSAAILRAASASGLLDPFANRGGINQLQGANINSQIFGGNIDAAADNARELIDNRYYEGTKQWISGSVAAQDWINKNFIIPPINEFIFGWGEDRTSELWSDQTWYQSAQGTFESVGNIFASWGVARLAGQMGLSKVGQQVAASSYFAGSIFGNSFNDAFNNGASIQDAYTYAAGTAITETLVEQFGGFKPGDFFGEGFFKAFTKAGTWGQLIKNAVDEGLEEVAAQTFQAGLSYYKSGTRQVDPELRREGLDFVGDLAGAFIGGFAASYITGAGQQVFYQNTVNNQIQSINKLLDKEIALFGEDSAVENFKKRMAVLVSTLNKNKGVRGIKTNKAGGQFLGNLNKQELAQVIEDAGLDNVIKFKPTTIDAEGAMPETDAQQKYGRDTMLKMGLFSFELDPKNLLNADFFKNKTTVSDINPTTGKAEKRQVVVNQGVFETNDAVKGKDLSLGGTVQPTAAGTLKPTAAAVKQRMAKSKVPVVFYDGNNPAEGGFYSRKNNVIYINNNSNLGLREVLNELRIHEITHYISKNAPELFGEIETIVKRLVELKVDKDKTKLIIEFKNKGIEAYFKNKGIDLEKVLNDSFLEMVLPTDQGGQGMDGKQALVNIQEELTTYFVESVLGGKNIESIIENQKQSLIDRIKNTFERQAQIKEEIKDKEAVKEVKQLQQTFEKSAKEALSRGQKLRMYIDHVFGTNDFKSFIKPQILAAHEPEEVVKALQEGSYDPVNHTINIGGKEYKVWDVFQTSDDANLKRLWFKKGDILHSGAIEYYKKIKDQKNPFVTQENAGEILKKLRAWVKNTEIIINTTQDEEFKKQIRQYYRRSDTVIEELAKAVANGKFVQGKFIFTDDKLSALTKEKKMEFVAVALSETDLNAVKEKETKVKEAIKRGKTADEVSKPGPAKQQLTQDQIDRREAAINILNRLIKRLNTDGAMSGAVKWTRRMSNEEGIFGVELIVPKASTDEYISAVDDKGNQMKAEEKAEFLTALFGIKIDTLYPPVNDNGVEIPQYLVKAIYVNEKRKKIAMAIEGETIAKTEVEGDGVQDSIILTVSPTEAFLTYETQKLIDRQTGRTETEKQIEGEVKTTTQAKMELKIASTIGQATTALGEVKKMIEEAQIAKFGEYYSFIRVAQSGEDVFGVALSRLGLGRQKYTVEVDRKTGAVGEVVEKASGFQESTLTEAQGALVQTFDELIANVPYDPKNMVIGTPFANADFVIESIQNAFKVGDVVAVVVPATWMKYKTQNKAAKALPGKKLVYSKMIGVQSLRTNPNERAMPIKVALQVWVGETNPDYIELQDQKKTVSEYATSDDFYSYNLDGDETKFNQLKESGELDKFDLAVNKTKFGETNFNEKITEVDQLNPKGFYLLLTLLGDEAKKAETLNVLNQIDYESLSLTAPTLRIGFTATDVIEEYNRVKDALLKGLPTTPSPGFKRVKNPTFKATLQQKKLILKNVLNDGLIEDFFTVDKDGNFVLRAFLINQKKYRQKNLNIQGTIYTPKEHAFQLSFDLTQHPLFTDKNGKDFWDNKLEVVKIDTLNDTQKQMLAFLKALGLDFVVVKGKPGTKMPGAAWVPGSGTTQNNHFYFIDVDTLDAQTKQAKNFFSQIPIHETLHVLFGTKIEAVRAFMPTLIDMLFQGGKQTVIYDLFNSRYGNGFVDYWNKSYAPKFQTGFSFPLLLNAAFNLGNAKVPFDTTLKSPADVLRYLRMFSDKAKVEKFFKTDDERQAFNSMMNEMIAQIVGWVFTDEKVMKSVMDYAISKDVSTTMGISKLLDLLLKSSADPNLSNAVSKGVAGFRTLLVKRQEALKKIYPATQTYTRQELNAFLDSFTSGKIKTRGQLIQQFIQEQAARKRGFATETIDNIIFLTKTFQTAMVEAGNNYEALLNEFIKLRMDIEFLLTEGESFISVNNNQVFSIANKVKRIYARVFGGQTYDSKRKIITLTRVKDSIVVDNDIVEEQIDTQTSILGNVVFSKVINRSQIIEQILEEIADFLDEYQDLDQRFLDMFGMPSYETVKNQMAETIKVLEATLATLQTTTTPQGFAGEAALEKRAKELEDELAPILDAQSIITGKSDDFNIYAKIVQLVGAYQTNIFENVITQLETKVERAVASLKQTTNQAQSPFNEYILEAVRIAETLIQLFKDNTNSPMKNLKVPLTSILKDLRNLVEAQVKDKNGNLTGEYVLSDEQQAIALQQIFILTQHIATLAPKGQRAAFYVEITPLTSSDYPLFNVDRDYNILVAAGVGKNAERHLPKFNAKVMANALARMIKFYEQKYFSSFGLNMTHNEYAEMAAKQIDRLRAKDNPPKWKIGGINMNQLIGIMTPQDYLSLLSDIFGNDVQFFKDFYREYVKAAIRRTDILQLFDIEYEKWLKSHPQAQEHSLEEVEGIDIRMLVNMRSDILNKTKSEVKKKRAEFDEKIKEVVKQKKENAGLRKDLKIKIDFLREQRKKFGKKDPSYVSLSQDLKDAREERLAAQVERDSIKKNLDRLKAEKGNLSLEQEISIAIRDFAINKQAKLNQKMTRGQLINMYLAVSRELEMEQIAETDGVEGINPTNHFIFGNSISLFDNELLRKKGFRVASSNTEQFTIAATSKQELKDYLEGLLNDKDKEIIAFAKTRFDANYALLDEIYFAKYGVHLPKQPTYVPFATVNSNYERNFKLKQANRYNIGVQDGLITETTEGNTTPLKIENIFSVIENHTQNVADYSYERLITDFQNLLVNTAGGAQLESAIKGKDNIFGDDNNIYEGIENFLLGVLKYSDITEGGLVKAMKSVLRNTVGATMGLNFGSTTKQYASIITIMLKNGINITELTKNVALSQGPSKYRRWLMGINEKTGKPNNSNFYFRTKFGNIPALAEQINTTLYLKMKGTFRKITSAANFPVGWADNSVLVGAFKSIADRTRLENPTLTEDEVLEKANETFTNEVLLFGVANTDSAFRSILSNNRNIMVQLVSRYQSENVLQVSALIRDMILMRNGIGAGRRRFPRNFLAFLLSGLFSAIVNAVRNEIRGNPYDEDTWAFQFFVNEFLWNNVIGGIPYINAFTGNIELDAKTIFKIQYNPYIPLFEEVMSVGEVISSMITTIQSGSATTETITRKLTKVAEILGQMSGLPVRNFLQIFNSMIRNFGDGGTALAMNKWYYQRNDATAMTQAIKTGDTKIINELVEEKFDNLNVKKEIARLVNEDKTIRFNLRTEDYFYTTEKDGSRKKWVIKERVGNKYDKYAQQALRKLIRQGGYRRLSDKDKAKAIQSIINYYYNYMKSVISEDRENLKGTDHLEKTVERTLERIIKANEDNA